MTSRPSAYLVDPIRFEGVEGDPDVPESQKPMKDSTPANAQLSAQPDQTLLDRVAFLQEKRAKLLHAAISEYAGDSSKIWLRLLIAADDRTLDEIEQTVLG
ncbi:MAG: hypothetical protein SFV32_06860 [Opitutaceae bacterium]|nr:hypothetical protein [Opitutaceae bacterium]